MTTTQLLPPKMLAQYIERAKNGDYEYKLKGDIYLWFSGNQEICVIGGCTGHVTKYTTKQTADKKAELTKYAKEKTIV